MSRIGLTTLILLIVILAGESLLTPSGRQPSLLYIISDDLRYDSVLDPNSTMYRPYSLPNIQSLMANGMTFDNAMSNFASCGPSRQSFLTGRSPDALGVWNQLDNFRQLGSAQRTFPEHLISEGYTTVSIGKVFHYDPYYGIDETYSWTETYYGRPSSVDSKCSTGNYFCPCSDVDCADSKIAKQATAILPRLGAAHFAGTPFFLAVGFRRPHLDWRVPSSWGKHNASTGQFPLNQTCRTFPVTAPNISYYACQALNQRGEVVTSGQAPISQTRILQASLATKMRNAYWASVSYMDAQVGKVMKALQQNNLERETIVVFFSDHGYSLGERSFWCKQSLQDVAVRIPLIVSIPWLTHLKSTRSSDMVELLDLYPTMASLLNIILTDKCLNGVSDIYSFYVC